MPIQNNIAQEFTPIEPTRSYNLSVQSHKREADGLLSPCYYVSDDHQDAEDACVYGSLPIYKCSVVQERLLTPYKQPL